MTARLAVDTYEPGQLKSLWTKHYPRYLPRNTRINLVRRLYAGELKIPLPEQFQVAGKEYLEFGLPTKWMMPLHLATVLQEKVAKLRRDGGTNPAAEQRATTVELWSNAAVEQKLDQDTLVDLLLNEGECALVVSISGAHWEEKLDYLDTLDEPAYQQLSPSARDSYKPIGAASAKSGDGQTWAKVDNKGDPLPKRRYQRDKNGKAPQDGGPFVLDDKQSARAHADELRDFKARQFPFTCRVIPADDCIPLYGPNLTLEGLIVRSSFTREQLVKRRYAWDDEGDLLNPIGNADYGRGIQSGEPLTLYEAYLLDEDGFPYCVYEVDGYKTYQLDEDGQKNPAVTDLYREFGLTRLPAMYQYGMHFARSNPANPGAPLGIPFVWPLIGVLLMKELVACGISVKTWWSGFPGYAFKPDENMLATHPELLLENNAPREFNLKPMEVTPIPGDLMPLQSPGLGPEVGAIMNLLNEALGEYGPNPTAAGNAGATGVSDRSLIDEQIRRAHAPVLKARRLMVQGAAEIMLELGTRWSRRSGQPLPIHADVPVPTLSGSTRRQVTRRGVVEIDEETVGDNYALTAYYPREFGDNLARTQQILEAFKDGASTWREMREIGYEDEAPEETRVELLLDKFYASDEYQAEVLADALQANGDTKLADKMRLKAQGKLAPDGMPAGAYAGVPLPGQVSPPPGMAPPQGPQPPAPMGPGGAPTVNMSPGNPGLSQLGGLVGAQVQAANATAGPMAGQ